MRITSLFKLAGMPLLCLGFAATAHGVDNGKKFFTASPGTYETVNVTDPGTCRQICQADKKCRGTEMIQPDVTQDLMYCHLNDGMAEGSPFEVETPEELNLRRAVADMNAYRAKYGLPPVQLNEKLTQASLDHVLDLKRNEMTSHTGSDGSNHSDRVLRHGYRFSIVAENVASGQKSWDEVFRAWQKSQGHNENLLRDDVTEFGAAFVYDPNVRSGYYWAMLVGSPSTLSR